MDSASLLHGMLAARSVELLGTTRLPNRRQLLVTPALHCCTTPRAVIALYLAHCDINVLSGSVAHCCLPRTMLFRLCIAAADDQTAMPIMRTLITLGADIDLGIPNVVDAVVGGALQSGTTPLMAAVAQRHADRVQLLLESGARLTPQLIFSAGDNLRIVRLLGMYGVDLNDVDTDGHRTAFQLAVQQRNVALIQTLYECGADVNKADPDGTTPLMQACFQGLKEEYRWAVVSMLLAIPGVNLAARDYLGRTALDVARREGTIDVENAVRRAMGMAVVTRRCSLS